MVTIEQAREQARAAIQRIKSGKPAVEPPPPKPESFKAVSENWLKRYVAKNKLRSEGEIRRCLERYVWLDWGTREFTSIRRSDITRLLDHIEDNHGATQADRVLAHIRSISNWHAARDDNYAVPFVKGMARTDPKDRQRKRILDDAELVRVWKTAGQCGAYGAFIKILLLTGQRRAVVASMRWADIVDGVWNVR